VVAAVRGHAACFGARFLFFTEIPSALVTLFVFRRLRLQPIESIGAAIMIGALTGYLVLIHIRNIGIVAGLMLIALPLVFDRSLPMRRFLGFAAAGIDGDRRPELDHILAVGYLPHHTACRGRPRGVMSATAHEIFERASGLLFDRYFGLIALRRSISRRLRAWYCCGAIGRACRAT
jgi:hypothetical protein